MGRHHCITWPSHPLVVEFSVLICPVGTQGKMTQKAVAKVDVFMGTCPSVLGMVESRHFNANQTCLLCPAQPLTISDPPPIL